MTDPPRVLMVVKRLAGQGGLQQQARRVGIAMRRRGVPVEVVGHTRHDFAHAASWERYLPTRYLRAPNQWAFALRLQSHLIRTRGAYDVIHVHGFGPEAFAVIRAGQRLGKPVFLKPGTAGEGTKLGAYARWLRHLPGAGRRVWSGVTGWICISEQVAADVRHLGVSKDRIHRIPNGVDTGLFHPLSQRQRAALRAQFGADADDRVLCTAVRLTPHKRVDLLIRAFARAAREHASSRLWIMGTGEQLPALQVEAQRSGLGDRIALLGRVRPGIVLQRFQAADAFALLSQWEGLSNALLEAMACGLPPIVTGVSGMEDVVRDRATGRVIPVDDEEAAASAIREFLGPPSGWQDYSAAATEAVRSGYSLDSTVDRLLSLYRSPC